MMGFLTSYPQYGLLDMLLKLLKKTSHCLKNILRDDSNASICNNSNLQFRRILS